MLKITARIEHIALQALMLFLLLSIVSGTLQLGYTVVEEIITSPYLLIESHTLFNSFSFFLVILIGMELLRLVKQSLISSEIDLRMVLEVAIIALCNKIITIDIKDTTSQSLVGVAAILLALAGIYFVVMHHSKRGSKQS